jgi:hypothetical protein
MDIFKSESFAESLSQNLKEGPPKMNSGLVNIYLSGLFCNEKMISCTGLSFTVIYLVHG